MRMMMNCEHVPDTKYSTMISNKRCLASADVFVIHNSGYGLWPHFWWICSRSELWPNISYLFYRCLLFQIWTLTLISYERYLTCRSSVKRLSHKQVWRYEINMRRRKRLINISNKHSTKTFLINILHKQVWHCEIKIRRRKRLINISNKHST